MRYQRDPLNAGLTKLTCAEQYNKNSKITKRKLNTKMEILTTAETIVPSMTTTADCSILLLLFIYYARRQCMIRHNYKNGTNTRN